MSLNRRRFIQSCLLIAGSSWLLPVQAELVENRDWRAVDPPQPSDNPGKIEVLEFFSYGCPHCAEFHPLLSAWVQTLPADILFRRVPVAFNRAAWTGLSKLYFTLESTGDLARLDALVFDVLHKQHVKLYTDAAIQEWVATQGVDAQAFNAIYNSFDIQTKLNRSDYLVGRYRIEAVPTLAVAGRYIVLGNGVKELSDLLKIANELIAKARAEIKN